VDQTSLELLEFPKVREILASFTSFSASRELALGLAPSPNLPKVKRPVSEVHSVASSASCPF
jgi:dsDNA-specific endonuclease/ATPase MutS2